MTETELCRTLVLADKEFNAVADHSAILPAALAYCDAHACSCAIQQSTCGPIGSPGTMFLAKVMSRRVADVAFMMSSGPKMSMRRQIFTMAVVESFDVSRKTGDEMEIQTGLGGGDCGYDFKVGERYLLDAYAHGVLSTGICSRTAPEASAALALRELRALVSGKRLPDLSGAVVRYPSPKENGNPVISPVPDIPVTLTGEHGELVRSVTGADGVYEVPLLSAGEYKVSFDLPAGLTVISYPREPSTFTMPTPNASGAACHVGLDVWPVNSANGSR